MIKENISQVLENIKTACEKSGRNPEEVTLVAVSKTKPVAMLKQAPEAEILERIRYKRLWINIRSFPLTSAGI